MNAASWSFGLKVADEAESDDEIPDADDDDAPPRAFGRRPSTYAGFGGVALPSGTEGEANPYGFVTISKEELEEGAKEYEANKAAAQSVAKDEGDTAAPISQDVADGYINVGDDGEAPGPKSTDARAEGDPLAQPAGKAAWLCEGEAYTESDSDESEDEIETGQLARAPPNPVLCCE